MINALNHVASSWLAWMWPMLWQASLLIVIVWALDLLLKRWAWPQVRYTLWLLVLVKLMVPPWIAAPTSLTAPVLKSQLADVQYDRMFYADANRFEVDFNLPGKISGEATVASAAHVTKQSASEYLTALVKKSWRPIIFSLWFIVALALGLCVMAHWRRLRRAFLNTQEESTVSGAYSALLQEAAKQLGLRRVPTLAFSPRVQSPAVFGLLRPIVIMPDAFAPQAPDRTVRYMLLHELAHIKRGDLIVQSIFIVLQIVYWFNPLLWLVRRRTQDLRELCCDATVAGILREETPRYRETLLNFTQQLIKQHSRYGLGLLGLMEGPENLKARLGWLEKKLWRYRRLRVLIAILSAFVILVAVIPMAQSEIQTAHKIVKHQNINPGAINGKVLGEQGNPISGATVLLYHHVYGSGRNGFDNKIVEEARCETDGSFRFSNNIQFRRKDDPFYFPDYYLVLAVHPDHALAWQNIRQDQEKSSYTLTMTASHSVTMTVTDMQGKALAGARVWPYGVGSKESPNPLFRDYLEIPSEIQILSWTTNANGQAVIPNMPATACSFYASLTGYATGLAFPGSNQIRLIKEGIVSGSAKMADGKPLRGAVVNFSAKWMWSHFSTRTDEQGNYDIKGLPPRGWDTSPWGGRGGEQTGDYSVSVESEQGACDARTLQLNPGEAVAAFDFSVQAGTLVNIHVVDPVSRRPRSGAKIQVTNGKRNFSGYSDEQGLYQFRAMPGDVELYYSSPPQGFYTYSARPQAAAGKTQLRFQPSGPEMNFTLEAPIAGRVRAVRGTVVGPDGKNHSGVMVSASAGEFQTYGKGGIPGQVATDTSGVFELVDIPEGKKLCIYAQVADRSLAGVGIFDIPRDSSDSPNIVVKLEPTTVGSAIIKDKLGNPRKNFQVEIWPMISSNTIYNDILATSDDHGVITVPGVIKGLMYQLQDANLNHGNGQTFAEILESKVKLAAGPIPLAQSQPRSGQ